MANESGRVLLGKQIGAYRITALLGAGGMGEVYQAEDTRLGRTVAVKVLPTELAQDEERLHRFVREARAASALNHANVAHIYEIGQSEGLHFIAMEYVEGRSLAQKMSGQPLDLDEVLSIGVQAADALDEAHRKGIIHRDIKSANLMMTPKRQVKVLDFGLAKITRPEGEVAGSDVSTSMHTTKGRVMGTLGYMSPEQVLGKELDGRTDLFSLGVVLYEMTTGRLPFSGSLASEVSDRILHAQPEAIARFNYEVPAELERIIRKCLEKDTERRYQLAREVQADLNRLKEERGANAVRTGVKSPTNSQDARPFSLRRQWLILGPPLAGLVVLAVTFGLYRFGARGPTRPAREAIHSIAVLPFQNVVGKPETEYLSDGLTEGLISALSRLSQLRIMAQSLVFRYKGSDLDPRTIGRDLKVSAVITGRVSQQGSSLVVSTEMIDVADGFQIWGEQFRRTFADALAIQEELAREISEGLRLRITGEEKKLLTRRYTGNPEAYELYLKGRYLSRSGGWREGGQADVERSIDYFQQAVTRDPTYALAYAGLAFSYRALSWVHRQAIEENFQKAKVAANKALEIDESVADAHFQLARVLLIWDWDWAGVDRHLKRALELNPNSADLHREYGTYLARMGRIDEARRELDRAFEIEPLVHRASELAMGYFMTRDLAKAEEILHMQSGSSELNIVGASFVLGLIYEVKGMYREAIMEHEKSWLRTRNLDQLGHLGHAYAKAGDRVRAHEIIDQLERAGKDYLHVYEIAFIHAALGEKDQAFGWLDKAYEQRDRGLVHLKTDPCLDPLRSDSRFRSLLRRMNLPE